MGKVVKFKLNGRPVSIYVEPNELLLNVLREKLGIRSPKYVCGIGECGACTVLVDNEPVLSCLTLAVDVDGKEVVTAEGLTRDGELHVIQKAFLEEGAVQCGYCIPGFVLTSKKLIEEIQNPTEEDIKEYIRGNLCRCTGYINIIRAIKRAAEEFRLLHKSNK
jgi:carbon-monoxide dehydrogenase small subunit